MFDPIPYVHLEPIGPLKPFGLLVAAGIILGSWFAQRRARQAKVDIDEVRSAVAWAVVVGFIGAHLIAVVYYKPHRLTEEGLWILLAVWDGISSFGGFVGALVGLFIFYGKRSRPVPTQLLLLSLPFVTSALVVVHPVMGQATLIIATLGLLVYYWPPDEPWGGIAEIILQALVVGWIFGRAGCFVAFDHPGHITDFALGEEFGEGGAVRHNLGLYEMAYTALVMLPVMLLMHRRNPPMGQITGVMCLLYAPARFFFDTLRATDLEAADTRFLGLTPAQYLALALAFFSTLYLVRVWRQAKANPDYPRVNDLRPMRERLDAASGGGPSKKSPKKAAPKTMPDTPSAKSLKGGSGKAKRKARPSLKKKRS